MATFIVDPGHGGTQLVSNSTPLGVTGPTGVREKDVALLFAQKLLPRLGGKALATRTSDRNLALAQRAAIAQRAGADVFLSVHANSAPAGARGSELWVHDRASPGSMALARSVAEQLRRLGGRVRVRRGPLAILSPAHHAPHTAGMLLELDNLADAAGERRLRDPAALEALAGAVVTGLAQVGRYGRTAALEDTWPTRLKKLIPDSNQGGQLEYTADVREAISAVLGLDAWDDVVSAGEKELEEKLHDILDLIDRLPVGEDIKLGLQAAGLLFLAELAPLGAGYQAAREHVAQEWANTGFAIGVVWAADDRTARELEGDAYAGLWTPYNLPHPGQSSSGPAGVDFDPAQERIARNCHRLGVIAGIASARELTTTQKYNLFADLQARDSGGFVRWDALDAAPGQRPWDDFYLRASTVFRQNHLAGG